MMILYLAFRDFNIRMLPVQQQNVCEAGLDAKPHHDLSKEDPMTIPCRTWY